MVKFLTSVSNNRHQRLAREHRELQGAREPVAVTSTAIKKVTTSE